MLLRRKLNLVKGSECALAENSWLRVNHGKLDSSGNLQARLEGVDVGTICRTTIYRGVVSLFPYSFIHLQVYLYLHQLNRNLHIGHLFE